MTVVFGDFRVTSIEAEIASMTSEMNSLFQSIEQRILGDAFEAAAGKQVVNDDFGGVFNKKSARRRKMALVFKQSSRRASHVVLNAERSRLNHLVAAIEGLKHQKSMIRVTSVPRLIA